MKKAHALILALLLICALPYKATAKSLRNKNAHSIKRFEATPPDHTYLKMEHFISLMERYTKLVSKETELSERDIATVHELIEQLSTAKITIIEEIKHRKLTDPNNTPESLIRKLLEYERSAKVALKHLHKMRKDNSRA